MTVSRRKILQMAAVTGAGALTASQLVRPGSAGMSMAPRYAAQVEEGLEYFRDQARIQLGLVRDLLAAIESGDLERAKMPT